jgi:hypothetical protein
MIVALRNTTVYARAEAEYSLNEHGISVHIRYEEKYIHGKKNRSITPFFIRSQFSLVN